MVLTERQQRVYRKELDRLAVEAEKYVASYFRAVRATSPNADVSMLREAAKDAIGDALNIFGDQAGTLACELFDEIMERGGMRARSSLYDVIDQEKMDEKVHYFAGRLVNGQMATFQKDVTDLTRFYVKRTAFDNMIRNCEANGVKYARVPSGVETCPFCFMLSSRGFDYHSEATAMGQSPHGMHDNCDCIIVPGINDDERFRIEGYNPRDMRDRWRMCEETIGGEKEIRRQWDALDAEKRRNYQGGYNAFKNEKIMYEVSLRDWKWLYTGIRPKVKFADRSIRADKIEKHMDEIYTGIRLRDNGIRPLFVTDEKSYYDEEKGQEQTKGYPDLAGGIEIKSLNGASTYNTINSHIKNTSNKEGAKRLVFDNFKNQAMSDEDLIAHINRSQRFRRGRIYIIDQKGKYKLVR